MPKTPAALVVALGLLLPAALLGGALWLTESGAIERLAAEEKAHAARGLEAFGVRFAARLRTLAATPGAGRLAITLDEHGRPSAPFTAWPAGGELADERVELELDLARALAENGSLGAARDRLAHLRMLSPPLVTAPLSFEIVSRLLEARLCGDAGDVQPARGLRATLLAGEVPIPAAAARPVVTFLDTLVPDADAGDAQAFFGAAGLVALLEEHHVETPKQPTLAPNGALVLPEGALLVVVSAPTCEQQLQSELHAAMAPGESLAFTTERSARTVASQTLAPLPFVVHAAYPESQPSERLAWLARTLFGLAGVAFLLGNLLAFRIARRERALARHKSEFVDLVSHELRTPLQALALKTEMLAHGLVPEARVAEYCTDAHAEVGRLTALVQRILDYSRLARRAPETALAPTDLRVLLARCVRETRASLVASRQRLVVHAPRSLGALVADAELLACAIRNLLHNASKFSPHEAEIVLRAERVGATVRVQVEDRGPGVAAHEREGIFGAFRRGAAARGGRVPGSGLGLAIVAGAMRLHQGTVTVAGREGGGAVFTLSLPAREASA